MGAVSSLGRPLLPAFYPRKAKGVAVGEGRVWGEGGGKKQATYRDKTPEISPADRRLSCVVCTSLAAIRQAGLEPLVARASVNPYEFGRGGVTQSTRMPEVAQIKPDLD